MRNLEQIQEHRAGDDESVVRKAGVFIMAAGTTMALVYGLGALMQQRPEHREHDPLAALAAAAPLEASDEQESDLEPVDRTELGFHDALIGDDPPEVVAALEAARLEHESLMAGRGAALPSTLPAATLAATLDAPEPRTIIDTAASDTMVAEALPEVAPPSDEKPEQLVLEAPDQCAEKQ